MSDSKPVTMVERMARALHGESRRDEEWEAEHPETQDMFRDHALAALRELREPTEVMSAAAYDAVDNSIPFEMTDAALTAAIDAEIAAYEATR